MNPELGLQVPERQDSIFLLLKSPSWCLSQEPGEMKIPNNLQSPMGSWHCEKPGISNFKLANVKFLNSVSKAWLAEPQQGQWPS